MKLYQQAHLFTAWERLQLQAGALVLFFNFHLFLQCLIFRSFLFYSYLTKKNPTKNSNKKQMTKTPNSKNQNQPHKNTAQPNSIAFFSVTNQRLLCTVTLHRLLSICQDLVTLTAAQLSRKVSRNQGSSYNQKVHFTPLFSFMWICSRRRPHYVLFFFQ